jgi:hypothetical protein
VFEVVAVGGLDYPIGQDLGTKSASATGAAATHAAAA